MHDTTQSLNIMKRVTLVKYAQKLGRLAVIAAMVSLTVPAWAAAPAFAQQQLRDEVSAPSGEVAQPAVEISGRGQQVSKKFTLQSGLLTYHATHSGSSNFIVYILDGTTGTEVTSIVNEIGKVDATKALQLKKGGTYAIQVQADGPWTLTLEQPRPTKAPDGPQAFTGTGTSLSPFFHTTGGLLTIGGSYQGDGRVAIRLRDANGAVVEQIANQVGTFNGSMGVSVEPGIYFLELYGNGSWAVAVE